MSSIIPNLQARARELGFNLFGIIAAAPSPQLGAYLDWIAAGYHGEMAYLAREDRLARRRDLNVILPGVRSIILVGLDYAAFNIPENFLADPTRGRISRYAWGGDYHSLMQARLEALAEHLPAQHRVYVDTGAILERSHAQQAGMGFVGKNTMLIHPRRGSYFFLGEILTTYEFESYDEAHAPTLCANCTRCLKACPTEAFPAPYVLDARRCISYLTIEYKGIIAADLAGQMGNWVYGCDVCQEVCPFVRRFSPQTDEPFFRTFDPERAAPSLESLLSLTPEIFTQKFAGSPILRIKWERMRRNAVIAAWNSGDLGLRAQILALAEQESGLAAQQARVFL